MRSDAFWDDWSRQRRRDLQASGLKRAEAKAAVAFELRQRRKAAILIGDQAAAEQVLKIEVRPDGTYRADMVVPERAIPTALLPRARAWAAIPIAQRQ